MKFVVLNEISKIYDDLIGEYKKVYERESKDGKNDSWKQKYCPENFIASDYQPPELKTESLPDEYSSGIKKVIQLKQLKSNEMSKL